MAQKKREKKRKNKRMKERKKRKENFKVVKIKNFFKLLKIKKLKSNKKKERREQPNQKTNPPMITSTKNCTKKIKGTDRTLGQMVKAKLYRQNHTKQPTHSHSQKEKKENDIYISFGKSEFFCQHSVGVL